MPCDEVRPVIPEASAGGSNHGIKLLQRRDSVCFGVSDTGPAGNPALHRETHDSR